VAYVVGAMNTLVHETVHAIADVGAGSIRSELLTAGKRAQAPRDYWVFEGLALWFEHLDLDQGIDHSPGKDWDSKVSVDAFAKLTLADFEKNPGGTYENAHALFRRFMGDRDKREAFLDFVRDFYAGHGDSRTLFR
jgi:hypothetical protein